MPLSTIIPPHLKLAEDHVNAPPTNALEQQMAMMVMGSSSEEEDDEDDEDRPSSKKVSRRVSNNLMSMSHKPGTRETASMPLINHKAKRMDFAASLIETNL